nr:von Willebrand factor-like [Lytechinus pictus]
MPRDLTSYNGPQGICRSDAVFHLKVTARCDLMSKQPFHTCHGVVDPAKYISDCTTLGCTATTGDVFKNTCPSFAAYIEECARQGQIIAWAGSLECQPDCPVDRVLLHCPHTEHRMCSDHHISMVGVEDKTCYPGCYCTPDKIFNDYSGECVEPDTCPCITANHALKQPGSEFYSECNICTCHAGNYDCHSSNCTDCEYDQEYSSCACGKTCANQNSRICPEEGDEECQGACECPAGTVLDEFNNECIAPEDCPCFHGNETFPVNTVSTRPDELCLCKPGAFWECIPLAPEGSCWAYGISSFNTYDDRTYTHNGKCSYVMSTDGCNENSTETFRVEIESLDCGEDPWACTKAVHIAFPNVTVDLVRGAEPIITPNTSKVCIRDVGGTYTMVRYKGLAITWDGANMVTITIEERFAEKVCGLCGNFDGRSDDDFLKQQGDTTRDVNDFVDSWATRDCLPARTLSPDCLNEVEEARRPWAESQCDIITSDIFSECHPYVSPTLYFDHCVDDAIKCYRGNGQDCMCDAVAAYAQKCIEKGICVDWREDHLCPVPCPCEDNRKYYACHSSCLTTCTYCPYEDKCITPKVEGCFCEGNLVDSNGTCVPPGHCYGKPEITTPTQPTQPPTTRPPTTQPPTTRPPTTQPPTTPSLPATTQPPTTRPPTTQPPTTPSLPATTQPPTTRPPTTQPPTTPSLPTSYYPTSNNPLSATYYSATYYWTPYYPTSNDPLSATYYSATYYPTPNDSLSAIYNTATYY